MLQRLSEQFTDFLLMKEIIENENREIYEYGLVALFSTAINIIVVLTIGVNAAALCPAVDVVNCPYIDGIGVHM